MCVLTVLSDPQEAPALVVWAARWAKSLSVPLRLVCHLPTKEEQPPKDIPLTEAQEQPLLEAARVALVGLAQPDATLWSLRCDDLFSALIPFANTQKAKLLVLGKTAFRGEENNESTLEQTVLPHLACDILLMRLPTATQDPQPTQTPQSSSLRILLPITPSEHARAALRLVASLAQNDEGTRWKALHVHPPTDEAADAEETLLAGQQQLEQTLQKAGVAQVPHLARSVTVHTDIPQAIVEETQRGYDLVLVGASTQGKKRRAVFNQLQKRLLQDQPTTALAVLYAAPPRLAVARNRFVQLISRIVPQMDREDRVALFTHLQEGSHASFNFLTLIGLSTAIAALGLLQNSAAVVIGAMLVAPLMTPMLGAGLALVQGNLKLAKDATFAILAGFFSSLVIGVCFGLLVPGLPNLTPEILARGTPNLLDLVIALLSGTAAAYALTQTGLMAALPGVAIAAALVPPIASVGIAISHGRFSIAIGAAFLFFTNLIAIILASSITFYLVGIRPDLRSDKPRRWARIFLLALTLLAFCIAFPLSAPLLRTQATQERTLQQTLRTFLQKKAPAILLHSVSITTEDDRPIVHIELSSPHPLSEKLAQHLTWLTHQTFPHTPPVRIRTAQLWRSHPTQPVSPTTTTQPTTAPLP